MLAACIAPAAHEWVEISQQHYRKPSHTHTYPAGGTFYPIDEETSGDLRPTFYPAKEDTRHVGDPHTPIDKHDKRPTHEEEEELEENVPYRVYQNHSIAENNWNKDRAGNIKEVDGNAKIKPNITPEFSLEIYGEVTESAPEQGTPDYSNRFKDKEVLSGTIERVPNIGSVKRVQLSNTPVKSPSVANAVSPVRKNDIKPYGSTVPHDFSDEFEIKTDIFKNTLHDAETLENNIKNIYSSTKDTSIWKYEGIDTSTSDPVLLFHKYPQTHHFDNIKRVDNNVRDRGNISKFKNISHVEENRISNNQINKNAVKSLIEPQNKKHEERIQKGTPTIVATNDKKNSVEDIDLEQVTASTNPKNNIPNGQKTKPNVDTSSKSKNEEIKVNTMENVMKFVKVVTDTISKNTKRGVNGKVKYLNELKDTLLSSISK